MRGRQRIQFAVTVVLLGAYGWLMAVPAASSSGSVEAALMEARKVSSELTEKVRGLLMEELGKGGYSGAVRVCAEVAQDIPRQFTQRTGHYVRRVSLGYRNPKDRPDKYERRKLQQFDQLNREQKLAPEYYEVVKEKGQPYLRYMKPLVASAMCIQCHGPKEEIAPAVRQLLAEKYPQDRAFGYHAGDVRGAISVKIKLERGKNP